MRAKIPSYVFHIPLLATNRRGLLSPESSKNLSLLLANNCSNDMAIYGIEQYSDASSHTGFNLTKNISLNWVYRIKRFRISLRHSHASYKQGNGVGSLEKNENMMVLKIICVK